VQQSLVGGQQLLVVDSRVLLVDSNFKEKTVTLSLKFLRICRSFFEHGDIGDFRWDDCFRCPPSKSLKQQSVEFQVLLLNLALSLADFR
jgi:hypothetical protein